MTSTDNSLRSARIQRGYNSQAALAAALTDAARKSGLRISISERTVRRWESDTPTWPRSEHVNVLQDFFQMPLTELGFSAARRPADKLSQTPPVGGRRETWASRHSGSGVAELPASLATDFMSLTSAHRRMYWSVPPARLHPTVADHAALGWDLLPHVPGSAKQSMARAVAESALIAGRLEFFDLQQPELARPSLMLSLQAASIADDSLLGAAALAHMAFAPAFAYDGDPKRAEDARDKLRGAWTFARRGGANAEMQAWLLAVEAEVETRLGETGRALELIEQAETAYHEFDPDLDPSPLWMDWFSPARLAGFKGNTLTAAGRGTEARKTLQQVLSDLPAEAIKQRAVVLADLAAAAVLEHEPEQACDLLDEALQLLGEHWYATAMDRVKSVRQSLREWDSLPQVRALDNQLYSWHTMIKSLTV
ncbi:hypothetical protein [Nocardia heshunensis]